MTGKEKTAFKKTIVAFCKKKKTYIKGVTDVLIDDLIFQIAIKEVAEQDVLTRGLQINVSKDVDREYLQLNTSVSVIHSCVKTIQSILRQLSISPDAILKNAGDTDAKEEALEKLNEIIFR